MNEGKPQENNDKREMTPQEEDERIAEYVSRRGEQNEVEKPAWDAEVEDFFAECRAFEQKFPLEKLHAVTVLEPELMALKRSYGFMSEEEKSNAISMLSPESQEIFIAHTVGREELVIVWQKMEALKLVTNLPKEELEKVKAGYKQLSQALGMVNTNTGAIDHTR
jgi:hypothetical protein